MKQIFFLIIAVVLSSCSNDKNIDIFFDKSIPQHEFAATDVKTALESHGYVVGFKALSELSQEHSGQKVVITLKSNKSGLDLLAHENGEDIDLDKIVEQGFALRTTKAKGKSFWAVGGDVTGAMYGGLQLAENISFNALKESYNEEQEPYLEKRGVKFNANLDKQIQSLSIKGDQDKMSVKDVWELAFWKEYMDELVRHRYNVLSFWIKHPFPVMVKLDDYPEVALADVTDGYGNLVKKMTIEEKIAFWQEVLQYAKDRSIETYFFFWNIEMHASNGKHGITEDWKNEITVDYLRKSVKQFLINYPTVDGIGVTAGEKMPNMTQDEKENWLWRTYGKGVLDVKELDPEREVRFIHRYWWTNMNDILKHFVEYKDPFDFSFKYARAHMYSSTNPPFEDFLYEQLPEGTKCWWNIRNDDMFYLRWGDPAYAREFILNFNKEKTAGYYMGSDGYTWGKVYCSKDEAFQGELEIQKHWYSFMLWGRLGYDPEISTDVFKNHMKLRFPEASIDDLFDAWQVSSKVIPQITRFFWRDWDFMWYPEGCKSIKGFFTVNDFMNGETMQESGILNIVDYCNKRINNQEITEITPLQVAENLAEYSQKALKLIDRVDADGNAELIQTKNDILAFAHLGNYYSEKILGATDLAMSNFTSDSIAQQSAVHHLENALEHWKKYADIFSSQYLPRKIARTGTFDWNEQIKEVEKDIELARNPDRYQLDISFPGINPGQVFPAGTNLTITVDVESTFDVVKVTSKINGEDLNADSEAPFQWNENNTPLLKNMLPGVYEFVTIANDNIGHKKQSTLKIIIE